MSTHGRLAPQFTAARINVLDPKWVTRHRGDRYDFIARHRRQARRVAKLGRSALASIARSLLFRVSHDKTLRVAWDYLAQYGGQAPGPDGCRYSDFPDSEVWRVCRSIRDEIRRGEYEPFEEEVRWISKGPGRGKRPLVLQSISDRVVQRAVVEIVQPLLDTRFDSHSFGFRPKRSALHALALAEGICMKERRRVWVTVDVRDAFLRVPLPRLLDVVRKYLIADNLVEFIGRVIAGASTPGLRQGGPLSPLLLNLYLDHFLDRKWRRQHPDIPLLRYADDLLLLCRSEVEARRAYRALADLLRPAGMLLKESLEEAVRPLTADQPAHWMGFQIEKDRQELRVCLTEEAWWKLTESISLTHEEPNSPIRVNQLIAGWVSQKGPCYRFLDYNAAYARIAAIAQEQAFDEIASHVELKRLWQRAWARWGKMRTNVAAHYAGS
jgi:hypothetical protein